MSQNKPLSILEFSRLTGIKRDTLRFYDRIDLLKPKARGENGYRYYTRRQLSSGYLISSLRLLGVGLEDIREYSADRTPEKMLRLFAEQEAYIQGEIEKLRETSDIMQQYTRMAQDALRHEAGTILLEKRRRERIFLCPPAPGGMSAADAGIFAYEYANQQGINVGYPAGVLAARKALASDDTVWTHRYFFRIGKKGNTWKPAGWYAVLYGRGDPQQEMEEYYRRLSAFLNERCMEIAGDAYLDFQLDELAVQDPEQYRFRIELPVSCPSEELQN